jgi:hypothetical protein
MTTEPLSNTATPILDLLKPLPEPDAERFTGRFALPFLTAVAFVVFTGNLSFLMVLFGFLLVNFLTIVIHEIGHLVAGCSVGLRFKGVRTDPFRIRIDSGKWKFKVRPRLFWGFAYMSLDRVRRVRGRLAIFIAGGPAASILCGIAGIVAGEFGIARYDSPWPAFIEFLGAWSLIIGCIALIPFRTHGFANDAMLLRALLFSKAEASQMVASYSLSAVKANGLFPPDYVPRWFRIAAAPTRLPSGDYYSNWLAYDAAQDKELAAQYLERCLAHCGLMDDEQRDRLIAEAAVFTGWRRGDVDKAEMWFRKIRSLDHLHQVWQTRVKIALLCARKQFEDALSEIDRGLSQMRQAPNSSESRRCEAAWISWRHQIAERVPARLVAPDSSLTTGH